MISNKLMFDCYQARWLISNKQMLELLNILKMYLYI